MVIPSKVRFARSYFKQEYKRPSKTELPSSLKSLRNELDKLMKQNNYRKKESIQALYDLFEKLYDSAMKDELTGAYNRKAMNEILGEKVAYAIKHNLALSVILIDLDNFKKYNDTFGHLQGDEALKAVTETIQKQTRNDDFVIRYGGEEFLIVLPNMHVNEAKRMAERIRKAVENLIIPKATPNIKKGYEKITISLGVTEMMANEEVHEFLERADLALYKAKRSGKNKVVVL